MSTVLGVRTGLARGGDPVAPGPAQQNRAELLQLLRSQGILYRSETQPVLSRDGSSGRWMLDSLSVSLTHRGGELAAQCLLDLLDSFESCQLATYGLTGVPLLQGCLLRGEGRYRGALVRKERKAHGSLKLIEGQLDVTEPVVIVDDSVSSGQSMWRCTEVLEAAGFEVEGGVCLVRFGYERGTAAMIDRGYRMESVFDIHEDFIRHMPGEADYPLNPTKNYGPLRRSPRTGGDGLHPAHLAREVIDEYLRTGEVLGTPVRMDGGYDSAGGCWVSLRRRGDIHDRPARSGFWHFPDEPRGGAEDGPPEDVVLAAVRTAQQLARAHPDDAARVLEDCAVAVTFFSALEECTVGELDNDRYGIVVRSRERSPRMGGALPRMPGIANEWEQFRHAWQRNAALLPREPFLLYRHKVRKVVEPGAAWQPTGVPLTAQRWQDRPDLGALAARTRRRVLAEMGREPVEDPGDAGTWPAVPPEVVAAFVTVYADGRIIGCTGGFAEDLDAVLDDLAAAAVHDGRFTPPAPGARLAVSVSLLFNRHEMGVADPEWVVRPTRFAEQALQVRQRDRMGIMLPFVAVTNNLTPIGYVREVIDKAGITRAPYRWTRYDCVTWLADAGGTQRMRHALPEGAPASSASGQLERLRELLVGYTRRHHVATGEVVSRYEPFADRLHTGLHPARAAYGAWIKARAGLRREAGEDLARIEAGLGVDGWIDLGAGPPSVAELAFVLLAHVELDGYTNRSAMIHNRLWAQVDLHGRVSVHRDQDVPDAAHQDYAPGQVLLALAAAVGQDPEPHDETARRALRHYRLRFRQNHHWGAVAWLPQAYCAWGRVLRDPSLTAFAYEVADWALGSQSERTGAFLNDHQADSPGATTALYLEGIAAVRAAAAEEGDRAREGRYRAACDRALPFLDQLVYQDRDAAVLPDPVAARGGVRTSPRSSEVRTDYVHHALAAVLGVGERGLGEQGARP